MLLITTPIGVIGAIHEAFRLAGGLGFLMIALMSMIGIAITSLVLTIRKEQRAEALNTRSASIAAEETKS